MPEGDPAVGLGKAIADVVELRIREREMKRTIRDLAQLVKDHETIFKEVTGRLHKRIDAAIAELEKHDCQPSCDGVPEAALEAIRPPTAAEPIYTAIFLSDDAVEALKMLCPPKHTKIHAHHVTLVFRPSPKDLLAIEPYLGKEVVFEIVGEASDDKGHAVKVTVPEHLRMDEQVHHVTISCADGISPVYSNELLKKGWKDILPYRLRGVVGHFTK